MPSSDDQQPPASAGPDEAAKRPDGEAAADPATTRKPDPATAREPDGQRRQSGRLRAVRRHRVVRIFERVLVALIGVVLGVLIAGHTTAEIGPIKVAADLQINWGEATLSIPPLGTLEVNAYDGPISLKMTVLQVDEAKASQYINGTRSLDELTTAVEGDLRSTLITLAVKTAVAAIVGGVALSLLAFRRWRDSLIAAGTSLALIAATGLFGFLTFDAKAFQQPKYSGLLTHAPSIVGNVGNLAEKFADYRKDLVKLVTNISTLYTTISTLPTDPEMLDTVKVLHISDLHLNPAGFDLTTNLVEQFQVDFVIDTGDIVDWGTSQEAQTFAEIGALDVPYVYIRGNHDSITTQSQVAAYPNVTVLDGATTEVNGLTIAGVGDPRFSPDRTTYNDTSLDEAVEASAESFEEYLDELPSLPDIVLFHDPKGADILAKSTPLILSGHTHKREVTQLDDDTVLMVQGSTGGAGLRGLEGEEPTPLSASVLYFDRQNNELLAWDDITVGGLGETDVSIIRNLAPEAVEEAEQSAESISQSSESASVESEPDLPGQDVQAPPGQSPTEQPPSQPTTTGAPPSPGE